MRSSLRRHTQPWHLMVVALLIALAVGVASLVVRVRPPAQARPVKLVTAPWAPYVGPDLPEGGPLAQIVSQVLHRQGYRPEVAFSSFPVGLQSVAAGASFGVLPMVDSAERRRTYLYSDPLVDFRYVLFFDRSREPADVAGRRDLAGVRVARIEGYDYWPELDASRADFLRFPTAAEAFKALREGRVDLVPEGLYAGRALVSGSDFAGDATTIDYVRAATPLTNSTRGLHLLLRRSPENQALLNGFNSTLATFKASDDYRRIVATLEGTPDTIELAAPGGAAISVVAADGTMLGASPAGARARVLAWPGEPNADAPVEIKVLEGPLTGRVGRVRVADVRMVHDGRR